MAVPQQTQSVSAVVLRPAPLPYDEVAWRSVVDSVRRQDIPLTEILIAPFGPASAGLEATTHPEEPTRTATVRLLVGPHLTRAAALAAAFTAARGEFVLLILSDSSPVFLRRSALRTLLMAATRRRNVALAYGDYEMVDVQGRTVVRHLLDHHPGRLRETFDMSRAWLIPTGAVRRSGGVNPDHGAADLYDLRLRLEACGELVHVGSRTDGVLSSVRASPGRHDVFDYLLDPVEAQREYEACLTAHLGRVGAFLGPDRPFRRIAYTEEEERAFRACLASVVIPVHHRPEFIGAAIESALTQTITNIEIIVVVNGGEGDPTADEVRRYLPGGDRHDPLAPPVRLLVVDVNNIGFCLNHALSVARGKYYVQLDSDDRLKPNAIAALHAAFAADPTVAMVIGSYEVWELDPTTGSIRRRADLPVVTHDEWTEDNGINNLLRVSGAGAPRSAHVKVIRDIGWFSLNDLPGSRNYGEDYDLVLRIGECHRIARVREPIYDVVRHPGGTDHAVDQATIDRNDDAKDAMRRNALHRRRALNFKFPRKSPSAITT